MRVPEAKDFLVQEIAAEGQAEGTPLSNLERRMLYFTESDDANEDPVALNEQFTAQYDTGEYEKKISLLMSHAYRRIKRESPEKLRLWNDAFRVLGKGDHYILLFWKQPKSNKSWQMGRFTFSPVWLQSVYICFCSSSLAQDGTYGTANARPLKSLFQR